MDFFLFIKIEFSDSGVEQVTLWRDPSLVSEPSAGSALVATTLELGTRLSGGCQRQANEDAAFMWAFAPVGATIVVT